MRDLNPKVISVPLKEKSYNIYFQEGLINFTDKLLSPVNTGQKWIIVSPKSISETYGSNIFTILKKTGFDVNILQLKEGEKVKSFFYYKKYINDLIKMGCNRDSVLISLGGGAFLNNIIRKEVLDNHISFWLNWDVKTLVNRINL